jgi:orotidine-5'-phosphate decarboxylase
MMPNAKSHNPLIIALDVETVEDARSLVHRIGAGADFYKVGLELYSAAGTEFVKELTGAGKNVFLDLKLYDIGETVKRATKVLARCGATFLSVHAIRSVVESAVEGLAGSGTQILAVSVLTSFDQRDIDEQGYAMPMADLISLRARQAATAGADGIVCSPLDVAGVRSVVGPSLKLVTPGVRSAGAGVGDQKRVATPRQALENGADYLVIGRQVTRAQDPRAACEEILEEIRFAVAT